MIGGEGGGPPHFERGPENQEQNPERHREWHEIPRSREVGFIGDLNGSVRALIKNALELKYIDVKTPDDSPFDINNVNNKSIRNFLETHEITWKGGKNVLVLLGDILGDRNSQGDSLTHLIDKLKNEARKKGGDIIVLAGNHDIAAMRVLLEGNSKFAGIGNCPLSEYERFEDDLDYEYADIGNDVQRLIAVSTYNLELLYQDRKMVEHIREIKKNFQLAEVVDDTLFLHSDVDPEKFQTLYEEYEGIVVLEHKQYQHENAVVPAEVVLEKMNKHFKQALDIAFPEKQTDHGIIIDHTNPERRANEFFELCEPGNLISTLSGWPAEGYIRETNQLLHPYPDSFIQFLRDHNIHAMVHGHTTTHMQKKNEVMIFSADGGTEKGGPDKNFSVGKITKKGEINIKMYNIPVFDKIRKLPRKTKS